MKKLMMFAMVLALSTGLAFAAEKKDSKKKEPAGKKYEVVDVACYTAKGAKATGMDHKKCAVDCINKGGELALLRNGDLFVPIDKDFKSARGKFSSKGGQEVEVKGKVISKGGVNYLQVSE